LRIIFGFFVRDSLGDLDWPFGCTSKSIATVMNITIRLFREFVLQPNAAFLPFLSNKTWLQSRILSTWR
jgi:hypothetical protein